jgi:hypothetical protein
MTCADITVNFSFFTLCHDPAVIATISPGKVALSPAITCGKFGGQSVSEDFGRALQFLALCVCTLGTFVSHFLIFKFRFPEEYFAGKRKLENYNSVLSTATAVPSTHSLTHSLSYAVFCTCRQVEGRVAFISHTQPVNLHVFRIMEISGKL